MEILKYPDPVLERPGATVSVFDSELAARARELIETMLRARGVGLAAPQVGWSVRLFAMNPSGEDDPAQARILVNPRIVKRAGRETLEEGCLSFPGLLLNIARATRVTVQAQDLEGKPFELASADPLEARIIQHETDHLDGVLFVTRMMPADRASVDVQRRLREFRGDE